MHTVQIPDGMKKLIERHVAEGVAASEADYVEAAIRRYAEEVEDDVDTLLAAAAEGITDINSGNFVTIASAEDSEAFWTDIADRVDHRVAQLRASADADTANDVTPREPDV